MLRLLTAIATLLSLFTFITTRSEIIPSINHTESARWPIVVKTHNQFDNWT
jgi:hypothetical protein